jgi:hypothetical protein
MYAIVSLWLNRNEENVGGINVIYDEDVDIILDQMALIGCAGQDQISVGKIHPNNLDAFFELYNNIPKTIKPVVGSHDVYYYELEELFNKFSGFLKTSIYSNTNRIYITNDEVVYE